MNKKLKIGILGCGEFSAHFVPLFQQHPYVEKVYAVDTNPHHAKAFGEKFNIEFIFASL